MKPDPAESRFSSNSHASSDANCVTILKNGLEHLSMKLVNNIKIHFCPLLARHTKSIQKYPMHTFLGASLTEIH